jgi:hypothetical protein
MKLLNAWDIPVNRIMQCLADDNVAVAGPFPFESIEQVQHFSHHTNRPHSTITEVLKRAFAANFDEDEIDFLTAIFDRLERDENALNWALHQELSTSYVSGNDQRLIDVVKSLHPACKLALTAALCGLENTFKTELPYAQNLDPALRQLADLCSGEDAATFRILPTDVPMSPVKTTTIGDPGITAINANASVINTLPKTVLVRLVESRYAAFISATTKSILRDFPMAAGLQLEVIEKIWGMASHKDCVERGLASGLTTHYKDFVNMPELLQEANPVLGGWYQSSRSGHVKFEKVLAPDAWDDPAERLKFLHQIGRLYGMAHLSLSNFTKQSTGKMGYEKELASTPGIPPINNFLKEANDHLTTAMIDEHIEQHGDILVASCAYQYRGGAETNREMVQSFLLRLALGSDAVPSNIFYEYGLIRLAMSCKEYLVTNLGIEVVDNGIDEFCGLLGIDVLGAEVPYTVTRKTEVFNLLPLKFQTTENKLLMGVSLTSGELEHATESVRELSLGLDLGL